MEKSSSKKEFRDDIAKGFYNEPPEKESHYEKNKKFKVAGLMKGYIPEKSKYVAEKMALIENESSPSYLINLVNKMKEQAIKCQVEVPPPKTEKELKEEQKAERKKGKGRPNKAHRSASHSLSPDFGYFEPGPYSSAEQVPEESTNRILEDALKKKFHRSKKCEKNYNIWYDSKEIYKERNQQKKNFKNNLKKGEID